MSENTLQQNRQSDPMLEGGLFKKMILYTVPIILTGILQLLFNAADLIMVGNFCGSLSVAAVGATGALINLLVNLFIGLSVGAGVSVAHALGAKKKQNGFRNGSHRHSHGNSRRSLSHRHRRAFFKKFSRNDGHSRRRHRPFVDLYGDIFLRHDRRNGL